MWKQGADNYASAPALVLAVIAAWSMVHKLRLFMGDATGQEWYPKTCFKQTREEWFVEVIPVFVIVIWRHLSIVLEGIVTVYAN